LWEEEERRRSLAFPLIQRQSRVLSNYWSVWLTVPSTALISSSELHIWWECPCLGNSTFRRRS
jgi:hypothetical protein